MLMMFLLPGLFGLVLLRVLLLTPIGSVVVLSLTEVLVLGRGCASCGPAGWSQGADGSRQCF